MEDLLAARSQMALSLAFHMVFATAGIGMPLLMVLAEGLWLRTREPLWLELARRWAKGTAILFAVGAVSGTVLSFELGLLWPSFMELAGPIIGLPFTLEGFAFFFEAIFLGIWLYGWERVPPLVHWLTGVGVAVSGAASGMFVVCANAWMNTPAGFTLSPDGTLLDVDPVAAMLNPSAVGQALHMWMASYVATAWLVAGVHAALLLPDRSHRFHRLALGLALVVAGVTTALQPLTGHVVAEAVATNQPAKLAALEGLWETQTRAPFTLLGWVDEEAGVTSHGIEIPGLLSLLAHGDLDAEVMGLNDVPAADRPPVLVTHVAYQIMLGCAGAMAATTAAVVAWAALRRRVPDHTALLWLVIATAPLGMLAIEAGWTATEVGRQPWVIVGYLRTADAVTPMPGLWGPFLMFTALYFGLSILTGLMLLRQFRHSPSPSPS